MSKSYGKYLLFLIFAALLASGCARQELVKKDEGIASETAKTAEASSARPLPKETGEKEQPIKESTIKSQAVEVPPKTAEADARTKADLEKIFFEFDSNTLSPTARDTLVKNAKIMEKRSGVKILIEGHCDTRGSDEYNLALGEKRARMAAQYLATLGVPAERLSVISYGKENPADPDNNEAAWAKNRRDEFVIISK